MVQLLALAAALGLLSPWLVQLLAGHSAELAWLFDLASHWQWPYVAVLLISLLVLWRRAKARWLFLLPLVIVPWFSAAPGLSASKANAVLDLHVVTANLQLSEDASALRAWLENSPADVVLLQEVTPRMAQQIASWADYPHQFLAPDESPFGLALLSRIALEGAAMHLDDNAIPRIEARLLTLPQAVNLTVVHPMPPISPYWHQQLNHGLTAALQRNGDSQLPGILAGDLNASPWAQATRHVESMCWQRASDLQPTWPSWGFGVFGIAIDQVLVNGPWRVSAQRVGPNLGSDHLPRRVHLQLVERL